MLSTIAFGYSWWNERTRARPSTRQKQIAQGLLIAGFFGSIFTTFWAFVDAARDSQQRADALQDTRSLALRAAERSNVETLTAEQQQRIAGAVRGFAPLRVHVTCLPGATELCKPLIAALLAAQFNVIPMLNYYSPGGFADVGPSAYPHQVIIIALPAAANAADALIKVLRSLGIDAGGPDSTEWTPQAQAGYSRSTDPYPLQIVAIP